MRDVAQKLSGRYGVSSVWIVDGGWRVEAGASRSSSIFLFFSRVVVRECVLSVVRKVRVANFTSKLEWRATNTT